MTDTGTAHLTSLSQILAQGDTSIASALVLGPAGTYERAPPLLADDNDATHETKGILEQYFAVRSQEYRECAAISLRGASVVGQGAVLTRSGALITDSVVEFTSHGLCPDGMVRVEKDDYKLANRGARRRINRPCLLAKRPWYRNYGHWLVDCATVIALASAAGLTDGLAIVIGDPGPGMEQIVRRSIEAFAWRCEVLIHPDDEAWEFDTLYYVSPTHVPPLFKRPDGLQALKARLPLPASAPRERHGRRLFVTRGDGGPRLLLNEDELLGFCIRRGFELVHPERLSLSEQATLFQQAQLVVGVKGAALANAMFMTPGSALLVLSPADFPDPFFWDICGQSGVTYAEQFGPIVTGRRAGQNDFKIDKNRFRSILAKIESTWSKPDQAAAGLS